MLTDMKLRLTQMLMVFMSFMLGCEPETPPAPYPSSAYIRSVDFDWSSHLRSAQGSDNWPVTWADDGHQYTSWGDGGGFRGTNEKGRASLGVARIKGDPLELYATNTYGGVDSITPGQIDGKSYGIISIKDVMYMWVSPGSGPDGYKESRLYLSNNSGEEWNALEWSFTRADGIVNPTFCQFGRGYSGARDDYVYIYANRIKDDSTLDIQEPGEIILMRVPKGSVTKRERYEFYSGLGDLGEPIWLSNIAESKHVFYDENGVGWNTSVSYNKSLQRYLLITEHMKSFNSNIGIFEAATPWGPWSTVYYGKFGNEAGLQQTTFFYNFSNKWLSDDGREFVLVFTGTRSNDSWNTVEGKFELGD